MRKFSGKFNPSNMGLNKIESVGGDRRDFQSIRTLYYYLIREFFLELENYIELGILGDRVNRIRDSFCLTFLSNILENRKNTEKD